MAFYVNNEPVALILGGEYKSIIESNIEMMKTADFISNTQNGTKYNLTDEEYIEAHRELQVLMKKQMYGGGDE